MGGNVHDEHFITKICGKRLHPTSRAVKVSKQNSITVIIVSNKFMQDDHCSYTHCYQVPYAKKYTEINK